MSQQGALARARNSRAAIHVPRGGMEVAIFPPGGPYHYLWTDHLNSCTAVAIVSPQANFLAHITPTGDADNSRRAAERLLRGMVSGYRNNESAFASSRTYIFVAIFTDEDGRRVAMPQHVQMAIHALQNTLQLPLRQIQYDVLGETAPRPLGWSSVVIEFAGERHMPNVYLNDRLV